MMNKADILIPQTTITTVVKMAAKQSSQTGRDTFMNANSGTRINGVTNWEGLRANGVITGNI